MIFHDKWSWLELSATTAAIVAGGTAAASYLEAKYHLSKDINALYQFKTIQREYARAGNSAEILLFKKRWWRMHNSH